MSADKNEILFKRFGINYNEIDPMFRRGSLLVRMPVGGSDPLPPSSATRKGAAKTTISLLHDDMLKDAWWTTDPARAITYIALGPLTNLALAARQDPALCRERIGRIVVMGGALDVPGNTSPVAECQCEVNWHEIHN